MILFSSSIDCKYITEGAYIELKARPVDSLSLREYVILRIFEAEKSAKAQRDAFQKENDLLNSRLAEVCVYLLCYLFFSFCGIDKGWIHKTK